ncbi:uncharacterized protein LOC121382757 [Gigantopelta aegis]|uniref:uncharacterized protein LOC121382757 n=1 Tax=Gigantopelta aegis TaxID=1735272 RepID=UPI001B889091|nr:uncharacterized protein LOC121382757 [Gigantopelta aegis]
MYVKTMMAAVGTTFLVDHPSRELLSDEPTTDCAWNCSGHGVCEHGHCVCRVQFIGGSCEETNMSYHIAFGSIFACLCAVTITQLCLCIKFEYLRDHQKSFLSACKLTVQKLLYVLVICAAAVRGAYFFSKWQVSEDTASSLFSTYYPFLLTGFSLIVCFWAEVFHISNQKPQTFLSKSMLAFILFNILIYMMLGAQLAVTKLMDDTPFKDIVLRGCQGGFAFLMIIVVILFLVYGVEVYFKVRGAFTQAENGYDPIQLCLSRFGLLAQGGLQLITALFLVSDALKEVWIEKLPVFSQNYYDIVFRVVEFGVALWFPCVLWNCAQPDRLWVLNPRRIFKSLDFGHTEAGETSSLLSEDIKQSNYGTLDADEPGHDCWICYDPNSTDSGALIQPCLCKGDVSTVHHNCLQKWLLERSENNRSLKCSVCNQMYHLQETFSWTPKGAKPQQWLTTALLLIIITGLPIAAYCVCHYLSANSYIESLVTGITIIAELLSLRFFCKNLSVVCNRIRVASLNILGNK